MKKIIVSLILIATMLSCKTAPVTMDSEPYKDCGSPLVGHYRNGETIKGSIYTAATLLSLLAALIFAPIGENGNSIVPVDAEYRAPISLGLLGVTGSIALVASPIDTAISYQKRNKKIIQLNGIKWESTGNVTKYQAIINHRKQIKQDQIDTYRRKIYEGTITRTEINMVNDDDEMREALKKELEYFRTKYLESLKKADATSDVLPQ